MSRRVFYTDFRSQHFFDHQSEFHRLGKDLDIQFDWIPNEKLAANTLDQWNSYLESADAIILQGTHLPLPLEESYRKIQDRIQHGMSVLVYYMPGSADEVSWFLSKFDVIPTDGCTHSTESDTRVPGVVTFRRQSNELLDHLLLNGVTEITITQPRVLWPGPDAVGLVFPRYGKEVVFEDGDERAERDPITSNPCVVGWTGVLGQQVVAIGGQPFHDAGIGLMGDHFPGVGRTGNKQFAVNLLDRITRCSVQVAAATNEICYQIESDLARFVVEILKKERGSDWWQAGVPENIRLKCLKKKEGEKLPLSDECYLDLIDLRGIIEKHWPMFENHFTAAGILGVKSRATGWIEKYNSGIRRLVAHPLKRHLSGHSFSTADVVTLREWSRLARCLLESARR